MSAVTSIFCFPSAFAVVLIVELHWLMHLTALLATISVLGVTTVKWLNDLLETTGDILLMKVAVIV